MVHKVKVTITRIRQRMIQGQEFLPRRHCVSCQREVEMLTSVEAAKSLKIDQQALACLIDEGDIHILQSVSGIIWVCKDSLFSR